MWSPEGACLPQFYRPLNIRIVLVGVEVWNDIDKCSISQDPFTSLHEFLDWRKMKLLPRKSHDNAQLIRYGGGGVGGGVFVSPLLKETATSAAPSPLSFIRHSPKLHTDLYRGVSQPTSVGHAPSWANWEPIGKVSLWTPEETYPSKRCLIFFLHHLDVFLYANFPNLRLDIKLSSVGYLKKKAHFLSLLVKNVYARCDNDALGWLLPDAWRKEIFILPPVSLWLRFSRSEDPGGLHSFSRCVLSTSQEASRV